MNSQEQLAKSQRGIHTDDNLSVQERLDSARAEVQDLRQPSKFDVADGLSLAGGGAIGGATAHLLVEALGDTIQDERMRLGLKVIGTTLGAVTVYAAERKSEEMYVEARMNDANHELTQAQNDMILANQQRSREERDAMIAERKGMIEKYKPLLEEANTLLEEKKDYAKVDELEKLVMNTGSATIKEKSIAVKEAGQHATINV